MILWYAKDYFVILEPVPRKLLKKREQEWQFYFPQIEELIAKINELTSENNQLTSTLDEKTKLLIQNNITY